MDLAQIWWQAGLDKISYAHLLSIKKNYAHFFPCGSYEFDQAVFGFCESTRIRLIVHINSLTSIELEIYSKCVVNLLLWTRFRMWVRLTLTNIAIFFCVSPINHSIVGAPGGYPRKTPCFRCLILAWKEGEGVYQLTVPHKLMIFGEAGNIFNWDELFLQKLNWWW